METSNVVLDDAFVGAHPGATAGDYTRLRITDTGSGMDATTLEHVFEPFFTTKTEGALTCDLLERAGRRGVRSTAVILLCFFWEARKTPRRWVIFPADSDVHFRDLVRIGSENTGT